MPVEGTVGGLLPSGKMKPKGGFLWELFPLGLVVGGATILEYIPVLLFISTGLEVILYHRDPNFVKIDP